MAMIELVDFNDVYTNKEEAKKKSTRRGKAKKATSRVVACNVFLQGIRKNHFQSVIL